jgi:hypothetical protein
LNVAVLVLLVGVLLVAGCLETLGSKLEDLGSRQALDTPRGAETEPRAMLRVLCRP